MLVIIGIILFVVGIVHSSDQKGYSTDDLKKCLNVCTNGYCITEERTAANPYPPQKRCQLVENKHQFHTSRYREPEYSVCKDECGFQGESYEWCNVGSGTFGSKWDYCNSDTNAIVVTRQMTKNGYGPCQIISQCGDGIDYCYHYQNRHYDWDYCTSEWHSYVSARTYKGKECNDMCIMRGSKKYFQCLDEEGDLQICAPPARNINQVHDLSKMAFKTAAPTHNKQCKSLTNRRRRTIVKRAKDDGYAFDGLSALLTISTVLNYANLMEEAPEYDTQDIIGDDAENSVYRYTRIPSFFPGEPELPLVVRARITEDNIRPEGSRTSSAIPSRVRTNLRLMGHQTSFVDNPDENGHLIAYQNGGPSEIYNFASQSRRLNRGTTNNPQLNSSSDWLRAENQINAWVRGGHGFVDQTVVVYYTHLHETTRPVGFGTTYFMFDRDGNLQRQCIDFEFSNDPRVDGEIVDNDQFWEPSDT